MEQFNKAKVVLLPTEKESCLFIGYNDKLYSEYSKNNKLVNNQHLYIISDDEIKEGDWYCSPNGIISQHNGKEKLPKGWYNIIATTDTSLKINMYDINGAREVDFDIDLPQPSQQFIEKYIESYNKGEVITDVLIEYEIIGGRFSSNGEVKHFKQLKLTPNNIITIKPVKDSWNREEMIENMWRAYKQADTIFVEEESLKREFNRWIKTIL